MIRYGNIHRFPYQGKIKKEKNIYIAVSLIDLNIYFVLCFSFISTAFFGYLKTNMQLYGLSYLVFQFYFFEFKDTVCGCSD